MGSPFRKIIAREKFDFAYWSVYDYGYFQVWSIISKSSGNICVQLSLFMYMFYLNCSCVGECKTH